MLTVEAESGRVAFRLNWRGLTVSLYAYFCENNSKSLIGEVSKRGVSPDAPMALVPTTLVESPLQLVQGAIHYAIYATRVTRIKNRGLLLASMITGITQLNELIENLESEFRDGADFYLVSVDVPPSNTEECMPVALRCDKGVYLERLVKNVKNVLSMV